jgi:hypothetical protein
MRLKVGLLGLKQGLSVERDNYDQSTSMLIMSD